MQDQVISAASRFPVFVLVSLVVFIAILRFVTRHRPRRPHASAVVAVAAVVVVGGMVFARFGNNAGLPWWIYYPVPALATLVVPPVAFKLSGKELLQYLVLAFLSSPAIHVVFSFLLDWHDYMPFIPVPSLESLLGHAAVGD
jgi:predicted permease